MTSKELQEKALEVAQLEWWLAHPGLESFWLEIDYWGIQYGQTEYSDQDGIHIHSRYPIPLYWDYSRNRILRPYQTDAEIQARIDHILSFDGVA